MKPNSELRYSNMRRYLFAFLFASLALCLSLLGCSDPKASNPTAASMEIARANEAGKTFTGIYWNPAESGTGFFFEHQGTVGVASFYMYEEGTGKAIWYSAAGAYTSNANGSASFAGTLMKYTGGQPASSTVYSVPTGAAVGAVTIAFSSDGKATVTLPARSFSAARFAFGGQPGTFMSDRPEPGIYWNENQSGRGFIMETQGTTVVATMFHYNGDGSPTWNTVQGSVATGALTSNFLGFQNGQSLSGKYVAPTGPFIQGQFTLDFSDPCGGFVQLAGAPAYPVKRFAFGGLPAGAECRSTYATRDLNSSASYARQNRLDSTEVGLLMNKLGLGNRYYDARQMVDFDGDGISELVVASAPDITTATPILIFKKDGIGSYADATSSFFSGAIPGQIHPRKVLVSDFNNDGRPDICFVDHGYDHPPFTGAPNALALSNLASGKWSIKAIPNNPSQFHHCAAAGDIDNNGTIDVFACGNGYQGVATPEKSPYFLLNDGKGNMSQTRSGIPASIATCCGTIAAELVDLDSDGLLDLIVGYQISDQVNRTTVPKITVFWGDGTGKFLDSASLSLPTHPTFSIAYDIKAEDIDGDGRKDLVLLTVKGDNSGVGYYLQVFRALGARQFADESTVRTIKNAGTWEGNTGSWFPWIHMADLNGDGYLDIGIGDNSGNRPTRKLTWINNGAGIFSRP